MILTLERQWYWDKEFQWKKVGTRLFGLKNVYQFFNPIHYNKYISIRWFFHGFPNTPKFNYSTKESLEKGLEESRIYEN